MNAAITALIAQRDYLKRLLADAERRLAIEQESVERLTKSVAEYQDRISQAVSELPADQS